MNIPKEAIERAIAYGWLKKNCNAQQTRNWCKYLYLEDFALIALDLTFWQALGKALGWTEKTLVYEDDDMEDGTNDVWQKTWLFNAHRFYDLILQGKPTDDFWQELLDNK